MSQTVISQLISLHSQAACSRVIFTSNLICVLSPSWYPIGSRACRQTECSFVWRLKDLPRTWVYYVPAWLVLSTRCRFRPVSNYPKNLPYPMHRYRFLRSPVHYPWLATGHFPSRREMLAVCERENIYCIYIKSQRTLVKIQRRAYIRAIQNLSRIVVRNIIHFFVDNFWKVKIWNMVRYSKF